MQNLQTDIVLHTSTVNAAHMHFIRGEELTNTKTICLLFYVSLIYLTIESGNYLEIVHVPPVWPRFTRTHIGQCNYWPGCIQYSLAS